MPRFGNSMVPKRLHKVLGSIGHQNKMCCDPADNTSPQAVPNSCYASVSCCVHPTRPISAKQYPRHSMYNRCSSSELQKGGCARERTIAMFGPFSFIPRARAGGQVPVPRHLQLPLVLKLLLQCSHFYADYRKCYCCSRILFWM